MTRLLFYACLLASGFISCNKDDIQTPNTSASGYINPIAPLTEGAVLVAVRTHSIQPSPVAGIPDIEIEVDVPAAFFYADDKLVSAGEVSIDGQELDFTGESYLLTSGGFGASGQFEFTDRTWKVAGEEGVPRATYLNTRHLPSLGAMTADATVVKGQPYTISVSSVSQADSLIYLVGGYSHILGANNRSFTFSGSETSELPKGTSIAQVAAYNTTKVGSSGGDVYLINEAVRQVTVEIQ